MIKKCHNVQIYNLSFRFEYCVNYLSMKMNPNKKALYIYLNSSLYAKVLIFVDTGGSLLRYHNITLPPGAS
jgi:hypothetical protein